MTNNNKNKIMVNNGNDSQYSFFKNTLFDELRFGQIIMESETYNVKVRKVKHRITNITYMMKMFYVGNTQFKKIKKEIDETLMDIKHENVVEIIDIYHCDQYLKMLLEYIDIGPLKTIIKIFGPMPEQVILCISIQMLNGIDFLQKNKVNVNNITPFDILINSKGKVKMTELGISNAMNMFAEQYLDTPTYMSPEILTGNSCNDKSCVWNIGVILSECIIGLFPFVKKVNDDENPFDMPINVFEQIDYIVNENTFIDFDYLVPNAISFHPKEFGTPSISEQFKILIHNCIQHDVNLRLNMSEIIKEMHCSHHDCNIDLCSWLKDNDIKQKVHAFVKQVTHII